jgi:hypothetical protein
MIADALAARLQVQGFCRLLRIGELQAYRASANASFGSGESRSTVSSITMSKS